LPREQNRVESGEAESLAARLSEQRWIIAAGVCLLVAATFLVMRRMDAAFVAGTLGIVAWFWNERNRLRPHGIEADERFEDEDEDEDEEPVDRVEE
jgi:hypothetical protein